MINVHPIVAGSRIFVGWGMVVANAMINFVIMEQRGLPFAYQKLGFPPYDGRKSSMGNRRCIHNNWEGTISIAPTAFCDQVTLHSGLSSYVESEFDYTQYRLHPYAASPSTTFSGTCVVSPGGRGSTAVPSFVGRDRYWRRYVQNTECAWYWSGSDTLTCQMLIETDWDTGPTTWSVLAFQYRFTSAPGATPLTWDYYRGGSGLSYTALDAFYVCPTWTFVTTGTTSTGESSGYDYPSDPATLISTADLWLATKWVRGHMPTPDINVWGDLCQEAIHDAQALSINSIAYVRDFIEFKNSLVALARLLKGKASAKSLSKLFLGVRYGLTLTYKDSKTLFERVRAKLELVYRHKWRYCRSASSSTSVIDQGLLLGRTIYQKYNYKVYYDPLDQGFDKLVQKMMDWDVFPTFQNIWDLVPFSFVIDWFKDFENYFDIVDTAFYATQLRVLEVIETTKSTIQSVPLGRFLPVQVQGWTIMGDVTYTRYLREIKPYLTIPRLRVDTPSTFRNYAELIAIILSQR